MLKNIFYKKRWILLLCGMLCALSAATNVFLLEYLHGQLDKPIADVAAWLPLFLLGIGGLFTVSLSATVMLARVSASTIAEVRTHLLEGILATPHAALEKTGKGALLGTLTDDIDNLANGLSDAPQFLMHGLTTLACFTYLAWLSPFAFAWFIATVLLGGAITTFILNRGNAQYEQYRSLKNVYYVHLHALFDGAKELATNMPRRRHFRQRELLPSVASLRDSQIRWDIYWHLSQVWTSVLLFLALGVALAALSYHHGNAAQLAVSYFVTITFVAGALDFVVSSFATMAKAVVSARVVGRLHLHQADAAEMDGGNHSDGPQLNDWRQITLTDVTYSAGSADGERFELGPVSLTLRRGEVVFLVGGNGSGKSTLAKVMNGLYQRSGGTIEVDGELIAPTTSLAYRALFSTVYSDYYLFSSVLGQDGQPSDDARANGALAQLGMADKVTVRAGAWSSTALSQGQRKRLALAQCWLDDAPVYVLDEWAADQDPGYRAHFYDVLVPAMQAQGKTLVVISHDERYFNHADRICKFDSGKLVEEYRPAALRPAELRAQRLIVAGDPA